MKKLLLLIAFMGVASGLFAQISKTVNVVIAGRLNKSMTSNELASVTNLTLTGNINAYDFRVMRDDMPMLAVLDLSGVTIVAYKGTLGTSSYSNDYLADAIPDYAFYNSKTSKGKESLTTIVFPSSLSSIGMDAFNYCSGLTTVVIPSLVTSIGNSAFRFCRELILITVDANNPNYSSLDGVLYDKTQTTLIQCPNTKMGSFTIPASVTLIGYSAFYGCGGLTTVTIPSSVTSIGDLAFQFCSGLTTVTIPSSVTSMGDYTFSYCGGLTTVAIPSSVTSIGMGAFRVSGLTTVTIPSSVTSIGDFAFQLCSGLTTVAIPSSVTSIGMGAFTVSGLTTVTIPYSVTSIGQATFKDCSGLTSITTTRLTPLNLSASPNVFDGVDKTTCILNVPIGSKSAYQVADQWKDFTNIVEKDFTGIDPIICDQKLNIYPNPTTGKVKLVFDQIPQVGAMLTVTDYTGKTILTQFIQNKEVGIDMKGNSPGVYLIRTDMKDFKVQKVILK